MSIAVIAAGIALVSCDTTSSFSKCQMRRGFGQPAESLHRLKKV
jgi:positive regulator of sigma E activity